jgi:hypothetical protein
LQKELPKGGQGTIGSQERNSLREVKEHRFRKNSLREATKKWILEKGTQ